MSYIKSYGVYFPHFSIADNLLHPSGRKNLHTLAYVDEDIITLAYAACENLKSEILNLKSIDAVIFATATPVFKDRYHASFLADLLGIPQGILALDLGGTNRCGTDALLMADALVASGKQQNVLVVSSDIRFPAIGDETRSPFGHAAVAVVISKDKGLAEITGARSYSSSMAEEFIYKGARITNDARFAKGLGFKDNMKGVLQTLDAAQTGRLIVNSSYVKIVLGMIKKAGFDMEKQLAGDTLVPKLGYTGCAHALLRMVQAIEEQAGSTVLIDYNNGSNVITFNVTETAEDTLGSALACERTSVNYQDYLQLRGRGKFDGKGYERIDIFSSEMIQEREKEQLVYLKGFECKSCGTAYYLKAARCNKCKETEFVPKQFSKTGTIYTLTREYYFPASFPPTNMIVIELDGGGRITVQQTDDMHESEENKLQIGDKVELVFRKMMENDSKPNYFWKCKKTRSAN